MRFTLAYLRIARLVARPLRVIREEGALTIY
jgi:hypothetical protein